MEASEEEDFHQFVLARWHPLLRTAILLTGDKGLAEDLVQMTLVKVHRRWRHIERTDAPMAYARAVLVNLSASAWRRRRVAETLTDSMPDRTGAGRDEFAHVDLRDELCQAVLTLPPRMRAAVVLRYFEDLSEAETARALGCSIGSIKSQTSRGLDRLRNVLTPALLTDGSHP